MGKATAVSAKIPDELYHEFALRVSAGDRSAFIREAIREKLQTVPRPDKIVGLETRVKKLEDELAEIKNFLARLEVLTYERGEINPHTFCIDDLDHKIVDHLLHYKGATTPELADALDTNRWLVLNRLRRIQRSSKKQLGKPIVQYHAGEKGGKKRAWWLNDELVEA
jgi:hypothetical protein